MAARLSDVLDHVLAYVRRFVVMTDAQATAVTLWIAHAHAFVAWDATPYLFVTSPTLRAGKTRLLEVVEALVPRPWRPIDVTAAAVFRKVHTERPTVLIDEVDALIESKPLRAVLNSGYRQGGVVTRIESVGGVRVPVDYGTFAPKVLSGITGQRLPLHATTLDRAIQIELQRRRADEVVEQFKRLREVAETQILQAQLAELAERHFDAFCDADTEPPASLDDRASELWTPLLAVADVAGGAWPKRARTAALALSADRDGHDEATALLFDLRVVFDNQNVPRLSSNAILSVLRTLEDPAWNGTYATMLPANLARRLRAFKIAPKMLRFGAVTRRGYERNDFSDAWDRYLGVTSETS